MPAVTQDHIRYVQFESFKRPELAHAVFVRHGGISPEPWASLNFGISTGDLPERTAENRRRAFAALGRDPESMADLWLVHSARILAAEHPERAWDTGRQGDGLVTDRPEVTLFMRFADCVPVLLYDPRRMAVGLVHAGWKGTVLKVAAAGVRKMVEEFGSNPGDLLAGIGPSVGPDHYEVGQEVVNEIRVAYSTTSEEVLIPRKGSVHLDLWAANRLALEEAGVGQVEVAGICTACHNHDYFSHRAEKGRTGRFGVLLALN